MTVDDQAARLAFPRLARRRLLERVLRRAMDLREEGRLGDRELTAINLGTAATLDDEGLGPLRIP